MSLYLASTTTLPKQLVVAPPPPSPPPSPPSIDLRRLAERGMVLPMPPPPPPPPLVISAANRHVGAKHKAVVVMGATGTGKSRLAVDLALQFGGEVINSDKIQVHAGLDVTTNKVTEAERAGVPHHLLGVAGPDEEFTAADFRREATRAARAIAARGGVPIVAGGSNSFVEELVDGDRRAFRDRFDCCFLWVDVRRAVLHGCVARRVDEMCARGMVSEVAAAVLGDRRRRRDGAGGGGGDYSRGIWRAIGVPELDAYLRWLGDEEEEDEEERGRLLLAAAVEEIKANTRRLSCRQRAKIQRLAKMWGGVRRVDATEVFRRRGDAADEAWRRLVAAPCIEVVRSFLRSGNGNGNGNDDGAAVDAEAAAAGVVPVFAPAAAAAVAG